MKLRPLYLDGVVIGGPSTSCPEHLLHALYGRLSGAPQQAPRASTADASLFAGLPTYYEHHKLEVLCTTNALTVLEKIPTPLFKDAIVWNKGDKDLVCSDHFELFNISREYIIYF